MKTVSAEYASAHLLDLLEEVFAGKEFLISLGGSPVARLSPVRAAPSEPDTGPEAPSEEVEQAFHGD
jgi:antitoxin (DNA-binding transcriptional repressor) of toxin-antitoxin stability system